jgi:poly(3-hydroxybutyrate) depolymerase
MFVTLNVPLVSRAPGSLRVLLLALACVGQGPFALARPPSGPPQPDLAPLWPWCGLGQRAGEACPLAGGERGLMAEAGPGWVRRYAVAGPFPAERLDDPIALDQELAQPADASGPERSRRKGRAEAGPRWRSAEDGRLVLARAAKVAKKERGEGWLVVAEVWSAEAVEVTLKVSLGGSARVFLNEDELTSRDGAEALVREQTFLPDDVDLPGRLVAGWNRVLVGVSRRSEVEVAWRMRLRGRDGLPIGGLIWRGGPELEAGCGWLSPSLSLTPSSGDAAWEVRGGLGPRGVVPLPWPREVALRTKRGDLIARATGWDAVGAGVPGLQGSLGAASEVRLEVDGATCLTVSPPADADARAEAVRLARAEIGGLTRLSEGGRQSLEVVVDEVAGLLGRSAEGGLGGTVAARVRAGRLEPLRAMLARHLEAARAGRDPFVAPGFHVRAYPSPIDGTLQRYVVSVPRGYQPSKRYPLVVLSHGLNFHPEEMMLSALGDRASPRDEGQLQAGASYASAALWRDGANAPPDGMILVSQAGYGEAGPRPAGRLDVMNVVQDVQSWLSVEPTRVTVTGFSLGGSVAFWAGLQHADLFAGAAPLCGYPNLEGYTNVRPVQKRPWEVQLLALEGVSAYVPNGRQLPLWMVHGRRDTPSRSEGIAERYRALGYPARLDVPDEGHDIWDEAYADGAILQWLAGRRRNPRPAEVSLRSGRHRTAALDWLRIDRFSSWGDMAELDGEVQARGKQRGSGEAARLEATVKVRTSKVDGFTLRVGRLPTGVGSGDRLEVDGQALQLVSVDRDVHVGRGADGRWALRSEPMPAAKRTGVEGPLGEVWLSRYVVIVGTADPRQTEANWLVAERVATPSPAVKLAPRVMTDLAWGDRPLAGTGAILIGGPASNRVTARLAGGLAARGITFEPGALVVGGCRHAGEDVGVSAIVPNPDDEAFPLVLHAGVGAAGTLGARHLPELAPDLVVYDGDIRVAAGDKLLGPRKVRWAGFFDEDWRLRIEEGACASTR